MPDKNTSSAAGYSQEDEHFKKQELEWLNKRRAELDATRKQQAASHPSAGAHWMKCPKCGGEMTEIALDGVMVDRCTKCHGVYFDQGEVELLLKAKQPGGVFKKLFG